MQLLDTPAPILRSNNFQESKFQIQASSKAFTILSSSLYSDKYKAIVRELATNASDAHVAAGISHVPIEVFVPSYLNPVFSVRDYGTGIDPEEFEKIYTTYFYSTKTTTNEQVGCFGLGSKSPFAYTDQFTVENHYQGKKYVYSCFKNETGEPSVALMATIPTNETGVKVSFNVKAGDFYDFESAAKKVLKWFYVKPKSNCEFETEAQKVLCFKRSDRTYDTNPCILMGQVLYPIDFKYFSHFLSTGESLVINVDIGTVDITPSRESVEYTPRTIKSLQDLSMKLKEYMTANIQMIDDDQSLSAFGKFNKKVEFCKDNNIAPSSILPQSNQTVSGSIYFAKFRHLDIPNSISYNTDNWRKKLTTTNIGVCYVSNDTIIAIKDKSTKVSAKIQHLIKEKGANATVLLVNKDEKDMLFNYGFVEDDFVYMSKVELPTENGQPSRPRSVTNCCRVEFVNLDAKKVGYYLEKDVQDGYFLYDYQVQKLSSVSWQLKHSLIKHLENFGEVMHVFTTNQYVNLKIKDRNFKNLKEYFKNMILADKEDAIKTMFYDNVKSERVHPLFQQVAKLTTSENLVKEYTKEYNVEDLDSNKSALLEAACTLSGDKELIEEVITSVQALSDIYDAKVEEIYKKYPLVKISLDNSSEDDIISSVAQYVDMIESK